MRRQLLALAAIAGIVVTAGLGQWQWSRAQQKIALQEARASRQSLPALDLRALLAARDPLEFVDRNVVLRGQWVGERTVWLDNRQIEGRVGFYVVTPLRLAGSGAVVLVQRGWAPRDFQRRERLPPLETPPGAVEIRGRLAPPPTKLYALGEEERATIRQNLDLPSFRAETGLPLLPVSVQQEGPPSEGLRREWPAPASGADRNYGYAAQWWALSGLIAILYAWFQYFLPRRRARA